MKNYKKNKIIFSIFIVLTLCVIGYGIFYVLTGITSETYEFTKDGYALYASTEDALTTESLSFKSGTKYSYKKLNDNISFVSKDGNVNIDESTVIHYADSSLLVFVNEPNAIAKVRSRFIQSEFPASFPKISDIT